MKTLWIVLIAGLASVAFSAESTKAERADERRAKVDSVAEETLERLLAEAPGAKKLFKDAYGYAVFSNLKIALGVSGGGGTGVAVARKSGDRTYMKMGTAGVGLGIGGRRYQVVFLLENEKVFNKFVDKGWQADTSASATAGKAGAEVASNFTDGLAVYQFSDKGLMAQAEIAGTKYWKSDKLN